MQSSRSGGQVVAPDPSALGRRVRIAVVVVLFGALLAGTVWGDDEHFPFGPFRMYASTEDPNGAAEWYLLVEVAVDGRRTEVPTSAVGLRRAELEGRVADLVADPSLMVALAQLYVERSRSPGVAGLEVVRRTQHLDDGVPRDDPVDVVVAAWTP